MPKLTYKRQFQNNTQQSFNKSIKSMFLSPFRRDINEMTITQSTHQKKRKEKYIIICFWNNTTEHVGAAAAPWCHIIHINNCSWFSSWIVTFPQPSWFYLASKLHPLFQSVSLSVLVQSQDECMSSSAWDLVEQVLASQTRYRIGCRYWL